MRCKSWAFLFYKGCETARMCLICALLLKKCLAVCLTLCLVPDARGVWAGRFRLRDLRAVWVRLAVYWAVSAGGLSHHKDGCSMYRSGCWCVGGLIVGVVVVAPGGACGRLPVRAAVWHGSCWARGCGRAGGGSPPDCSMDDLPGGIWMQRAMRAAVWLCGSS